MLPGRAGRARPHAGAGLGVTVKTDVLRRLTLAGAAGGGMSVGTSFQSLLRTWLKHSNADHFDDCTWRPGAAQWDKLLEICSRNAGTDFGRQHGFDRIRSVDDYRAAVPPQTYDTLAPWIDRVTAGEANVLTADEPLMFATTSGTTGAAKYIPVTPSYLQEYSHGIHVHTYRMMADFPDLLEGRVLVSSSNDEEGRTAGGVPYGAISGYLTRTQPAVLRRYFVLPYEVCRIKDIEAKYYLTLRHALAADVRGLHHPQPVQPAAAGSGDAEPRRRAHRRHPPGHGQPRLPARRRPAGPHRRAGGRHAGGPPSWPPASGRTGRLIPAEAWPNLRVISCWKGGTMPLYLRKLPEYFGDVPVRDLGYMASEGRGSTPLVNSGAAGVLNVDHPLLRVRARPSSATGPIPTS